MVTPGGEATLGTIICMGCFKEVHWMITGGSTQWIDNRSLKEHALTRENGLVPLIFINTAVILYELIFG